jgi:hypothetical protein
MRVLGVIFVLAGFLISLTIVGAIIGIPMMLVGALFIAAGGRRPVITNVITVQQGPQSHPAPPAIPAGEDLKRIN